MSFKGGSFESKFHKRLEEEYGAGKLEIDTYLQDHCVKESYKLQYLRMVEDEPFHIHGSFRNFSRIFIKFSLYIFSCKTVDKIESKRESEFVSQTKL